MLKFFGNTTISLIDPENRAIWLNRIFVWHADDYGKSPDKVLGYIAGYRPAMVSRLDQLG